MPHLSVLIRGTIFSHYFQSSLLFLTVTVLEGRLNVDMNAFLWKVCMCPCVCVCIWVFLCVCLQGSNTNAVIDIFKGNTHNTQSEMKKVSP